MFLEDKTSLRDLYKKLKSSFIEDPDTRPRKHLNELALMLLAFASDREEDVGQFLNSLKYYSDPKCMANDEGISGEWAFTVLDFFRPVHCRLILADRKKAFLLRNFVFKNFVYKLLGAKRLTFLATLFADLHYDCQFENGEHWVVGIGKYISQNFFNDDCINIDEFRIYLRVVFLFMGDQSTTIFGDAEESKTILSRICHRNYRINRDYIWECLDVFYKSIRSKSFKVQATETQVKNFTQSQSKARWKKAFSFSRLFEFFRNHFESERRWTLLISSIFELSESNATPSAEPDQEINITHA